MTTASPAVPTVPFHHDHRGAIPILGFGTWQAEGDDAYRAVRTALDDGYRHIDTAVVYGNHAEVGRAIADSGVARDDLFVTSKIGPNLAAEADDTLNRALDDLRLDHLDLWLIHWTEGSAHVDLWESLLQARADERARAVGVSNYSVEQVDEITTATDVAPALNQVQWGPPIYDPAFAESMTERQIVLEGYSALKLTALDDPVLTRIGSEHDATVAQVITRWHIDHGVVTIPKSVTPARIAENFDVFGFDLSDDQLAQIDALAD